MWDDPRLWPTPYIDFLGNYTDVTRFQRGRERRKKDDEINFLGNRTIVKEREDTTARANVKIR